MANEKTKICIKSAAIVFVIREKSFISMIEGFYVTSISTMMIHRCDAPFDFCTLSICPPEAVSDSSSSSLASIVNKTFTSVSRCVLCGSSCPS